MAGGRRRLGTRPRRDPAGQLKGREVSAHALTHAHPDHQGASHSVCEALGLARSGSARGDVDAAENPDLIGERQPDHWLSQLFLPHDDRAGPSRRSLAAGRRRRRRVSGFSRCQATQPGHSSLSGARTTASLILGDVLNGADPLTAVPGLREPKTFLHARPGPQPRVCPPPGRSCAPKVVAFGHGPVCPRHAQVRRLRSARSAPELNRRNARRHRAPGEDRDLGAEGADRPCVQHALPTPVYRHQLGTPEPKPRRPSASLRSRHRPGVHQADTAASPQVVRAYRVGVGVEVRWAGGLAARVGGPRA